MRILQVCPLWHPVARDAPGGIETFLAQLAPELEKLGCRVTLLASGDSRTPAELIPVVSQSLYGQMAAGTAAEYAYYEQHQLRLALGRAPEFDVLHSHVGCGAYVLSGLPGIDGRVLHTQHTPVYQDLEWFVRQHPDTWFSTVSEFQARKLWKQGATRCRAIHNGIDVADFTFKPGGAEGLLFIGRMEWAKGPDLAVQVARRLGRSLTLAGPIIEGEFFEHAVKPFLNDQIQYVGVVDHRQKNELFGQAGCVVLPFRGEEPFGLVTIEAMACGTPVVALASGALPEIVEPGLTGYLTQEEEALPALVTQAIQLDRAAIRARVTGRFDLSVAAQKYRQLYTRVASTRPGEDHE